jgi:dTDP-4-amino-4,6-dideoxygalactose transaminase
VFPEGPPPWPLPDEDVLQALQTAYADGSWGQYHGGRVERLEECLAQYHAVEFAVTCASGTFAVELALRALKVGPGDEVLMAAYDYGGNFLSVHAVGARPVLVDVAAANWNLDPARLEAAIGPATRAVIASHLHGGVVPMTEVMEIARRHGLAVIEDAAQMPGAIVQGRTAGTWGDVAILSFGGSKLLTAGRGGALLTRRADIHHRARLLLHRGNAVCPLSELQAAVLLPQLDKLDARNALRAHNVQLLTRLVEDIPGLRPFTNALRETQPGYYKLGWQYDAGRFGLSRQRLIAAVRAEGVALDEGFKALHVGRSPSRYRAADTLAEASRAHEGTLVLHHPVLLGTPPQIEAVAAAIQKVYANAERLGPGSGMPA